MAARTYGTKWWSNMIKLRDIKSLLWRHRTLFKRDICEAYANRKYRKWAFFIKENDDVSCHEQDIKSVLKRRHLHKSPACLKALTLCIICWLKAEAVTLNLAWWDPYCSFLTLGRKERVNTRLALKKPGTVCKVSWRYSKCWWRCAWRI